MRWSVQGVSADVVSSSRILLIDDEQRILDFVGRALRLEGFTVDRTADGAEGLGLALSRSYDLVILDLLMPGLDGVSILRGIVEGKPGQSVLVLSALADSASKVKCLELGAEDYLAKPFSLDELLARVRARLRRLERAASTTLTARGITLDLISRKADVGGGLRISLADREFRLLRELMMRAGQTISKERLLASVWGFHFDPGSNVVDVCVRRLRAKLGHQVITTVRGEGYRIDAP